MGNAELFTEGYGEDMRHLGDITKINGAEIEPVDVITAGSPCQDLSVAGKRAGLDGERSGLFMEQNTDLTQRQLAEVYGISKSRINQIIKEVGWTDIGDWTDSKGRVHKGDADSPRYKALGNSIALPFWFYLLRRISAQYERPATLGSLFDGISGFPLCWERCNGIGTARWSSEIEEFPMAVCKRHFGDEDTGEEGDIRKYI